MRTALVMLNIYRLILIPVTMGPTKAHMHELQYCSRATPKIVIYSGTEKLRTFRKTLLALVGAAPFPFFYIRHFRTPGLAINQTQVTHHEHKVGVVVRVCFVQMGRHVQSQRHGV